MKVANWMKEFLASTLQVNLSKREEARLDNLSVLCIPNTLLLAVKVVMGRLRFIVGFSMRLRDR